MEELMKQLVEKTGLPVDKLEQVVGGMLDQAKGMFGGLLGGDK